MEKDTDINIENKCIYGKDTTQDLNTLLDACRTEIPDFDEALVTKAYWFCVNEHKDLKRDSGDPYYTHPLKVALILVNILKFNDSEAVAAALLHDTVEDVAHVTFEVIEKEFGKSIAGLVEGLTKIKSDKLLINPQAPEYKGKSQPTKEELFIADKAHTYSKLFAALIKDIRVIIIKLADRLDNLRTLGFVKNESKRIRIAEESLNFYIPFAQRLGLNAIRPELEDLSLYFKDRASYDTIRPALKEKRLEYLDLFDTFTRQVDEKLNERGISHAITVEHKHVYEIYKMLEEGKDLSQIDNFYSMVIVLHTNDTMECYKVYGIISSIFGPVSNLDDRIARPKVNLYRALHSTHFGPNRKPVEVIIRTEEMDNIADKGITAFGKLSDINRSLELSPETASEWVKWIEDIIGDYDPDAIQKIWGSIRRNLYAEDITVHTVNGNSYSLPKGSCPIDLAFAISDLHCLQCLSAKVNGEVKSLDYELKNFDTVEIITSPNASPVPGWEDYVVTHKAIVRLYNYNKTKKLTKESKPILSKIVKIRVRGEDRPGMLHEITHVIGTVNIQRINLHKSDTQFEGMLTLAVEDDVHFNTLLTPLLGIKGIFAVERVEE